MTEAQLLYQSLYRVQVLNSEHDPFEVSPKWSADDIRMLFMESPAAPTHWHVTKEFSVKNRGQVLREHVPGHVDRWLENGGRYQWKVKFSAGKVELMDVEQLAAAVAYSHALGMRLPPLYNLDVFEYELDNPMALYGSIPVLVAPNKVNTVGMFWNNPTETYIDIWTNEEATSKSSHWLSESGVFDLFLLAGPSRDDLFSQYTLLTGRAQLPPLFALGYHQSRWNYKNEADVARVNVGFDEHLIPYDVLWLEIDHLDGRRYFTWDGHNLPTPKDMQESLARTSRKTVTIVDPHIKVSQPKDKHPYYIHKEAEELGLFIKDEEGDDFKG
ncbi:hypothetical protein PInf_000035 [Phytophthora infestans]|nr:hypothetical protein PInf_000035 [Phytophthora infestans]